MLLRGRTGKGFTLVELLIAMGIIGTLAAILTPVLIRARFKTYHSACIQNVRNLATALELYSLEYDTLYPADIDALTTATPPYIAYIDVCPSNALGYKTNYSVTNANQEYLLECPGIHELQLTGLVDDRFPRAMNGRIDTNRAP